MLISPKYDFNKPQFKAQKIAQVKNCYQGLTTHIDIYRINKTDIKFLKKLLRSIDIKKLLPKVSEDLQKTYQDIFKATVFNAMDPNNTAYIAFNENIPCGLFTLRPGKTTSILDLVAIPTSENQTTNLIGQTLLYQGFRDSQKANAKKIQLEAIKKSIGNPVEKYIKWGLKEVDSGDKYIQMECDKSNINKQLKRFARKIKYKEVRQKNTNIESFID